MGLTEDEFNKITPVEFDALKKRHSERELFFERLIARVILALYLQNVPSDDPDRGNMNVTSFIGFGNWAKNKVEGNSPKDIVDLVQSHFKIQKKE